MSRSGREPVPADEQRYHQREWRVQRIGWACMGLIVLGSAAGLFGSGPLSKAHSGDQATGTIDYDRFARYGAETVLRICAPRSANDPSELRVSIPRGYLEALAIRSIVPEARSMRGSPQQVDFAFDVSSRGSCVVFRLEPRQVGFANGPFTLAAGNDVAVHQFVYP